MKKILVIIFLFLCAFGASSQNYAVQPQNSGISDLFNSTFFLNDTLGCLAWQSMSQGGILRTSDGGTTWHKKVLSSNPIRSVYFTSIDTGYAAGDDGIFKTTDMGTTWSLVYSGNFRSIYFTGKDTGFAAGNYGDGYGIFKTTDEGSTWTNVFNQSAVDYLFFYNSNVGYGSQVEYPYTDVYKTTNAGNTWSTINIPGLDDAAVSIFFTTLDTGYVAEMQEGIYKTTDGGNSWTSLNFGIPIAVTSIFFLNSSVGFAAGSGNFSGYILNTNDGGTTWNTIYSNSDSSSVLGGLFFPSTCVGYATGNMGTVLKIECTVGVDEVSFSDHEIEIYPNPASDNFVIENLHSDKSSMEIFTITGQLIMQQNISGSTAIINISGLEQGLYFVQLKNENGVYVKKLIKQ